MDIKFEKLSQFFEHVKSLSFWQRLFKWSKFRALSYEAYEEFRTLLSKISQVSQELEQTRSEISVLRNDNEHFKNTNTALEGEIKTFKNELVENTSKISDLNAAVASKDETIKQTQSKLKDLEIETAAIKEKLNQLTQENSQLRQENTIFKQTENDRRTKYESDVAALNSIRQQIETDRNNETSQRQQEELKRLAQMNETWARHQDTVKETIKLICQKHTIEYVDKVPFRGNPDNAIKICDEFVIFDAKSPASEDLNNFPTYIKQQTESVRKYIKEENVKKDIFLVIPSNTVEVIDVFSYNMADYNVYVVTLDALEPIILSLKKLEEYAFVEQLSPEERNNICRVIGKFAYAAKRRIQIDHFFDRFFLEMLSRYESDLPADVLQTVSEYEKSEKLNPPQDKRGKQLLIKDLESEGQKIKREAEAKGIIFPTMVQQEIKSLPLYEGETSTDEKEQ